MNEEVEFKTAEEVIKWAIKEFQDRVALASSFGVEDVVLIDMLVKGFNELRAVNCETQILQPRIFTLDTGRLPEETYEIIEKIREKYGVNFEVYFPNTSEVEEMVRKYGPNLFYESVEKRQLCCRVRKVEPLNRALENLDAWICGLRREQSITRANIKKVEYECRISKVSQTESPRFQAVSNEKQTTNRETRMIVKINPLADWTEGDVWRYVKENKVPYNALHDKNYPSIGCAPCTRAIKPGEDIRSGRWWWEAPEKKECGLHTKVC